MVKQKNCYRTDVYRKQHREYNRRRRARLGSSATSEYDKRRRMANPEQCHARSALRHAINAGDIEKPKQCSKCKRKEAVQGHHPDYSKPFDVVWLCPLCHTEEHIKLKSAVA